MILVLLILIILLLITWKFYQMGGNFTKRGVLKTLNFWYQFIKQDYVKYIWYFNLLPNMANAGFLRCLTKQQPLDSFCDVTFQATTFRQIFHYSSPVNYVNQCKRDNIRRNLLFLFLESVPWVIAFDKNFVAIILSRLHFYMLSSVNFILYWSCS